MLTVLYDEPNMFTITYNEIVEIAEPGEFFQSRDGIIFMVARDINTKNDRLVSLQRSPYIITEGCGYEHFRKLKFDTIHLKYSSDKQTLNTMATNVD